MRLSDGYLTRISTCQHSVNDRLNHAPQFTVAFTPKDSTVSSTETTQKIITIPDQIQKIENHRCEWNIKYLNYIFFYFEVTFDDKEKFKPPSDEEWNEIFTNDSVRFSKSNVFRMSIWNRNLENVLQINRAVPINGQIGKVHLMQKMVMILRFSPIMSSFLGEFGFKWTV